MIKLKHLLTESYFTFERILTQLGYKDDTQRHEYRFTKPLATGLLCFDVDEEWAPNGKRSNIFRFTFYFEPYVREKSRMLGLYKKRYHAASISLGADTIDFGTGLFRIDDAAVETRLKTMLQQGESRIEQLQVSDLDYEAMPKSFEPTKDIIKKI